VPRTFTKVRSEGSIVVIFAGLALYLEESPNKQETSMANRKQFLSRSEDDAELLQLLARTQDVEVSDEVLHEQRVSFAFGNAMNDDTITKDSVKRASESIRLRA